MNSAAEQLAEAVAKAESCKFNSLTCSCLSKVLLAAANKLCECTPPHLLLGSILQT